jgi:hypothetical protein
MLIHLLSKKVSHDHAEIFWKPSGIQVILNGSIKKRAFASQPPKAKTLHPLPGIQPLD